MKQRSDLNAEAAMGFLDIEALVALICRSITCGECGNELDHVLRAALMISRRLEPIREFYKYHHENRKEAGEESANG